MRLRYLLLTVLFILFAGASSAAASNTDNDGNAARLKLISQVQNLLNQERFDELDKIALKLRTSKERFDDGGWKIYTFYQLPLKELKSEGEWAALFNKLERWRQKYPGSIPARVATGRTYIEYAWLARGGGYADKVSENGWRLFHERLEKAFELLINPPSRNEHDCPYRYTLLLEIARLQGWEKEAHEKLFRKAISLEPDFYSHYIERAEFLRPRWSGEDGEWQHFAENATKYTSVKEGKTIYTRIVWTMWRNEFNEFPYRGLSWERMKQGFRDIEKNYPNSPLVLNVFCKFACFAQDDKTTRELMKRINERPLLDAWDSAYNTCRNWVGYSNTKY